MPPNTFHSLVLSLQTSVKHVPQPLPAEEQLALLFHLANSPSTVDAPNASVPYTSLSLNDAYRECARITRHHSKSFYFSTQFLPPEKRRAVRALYAFCRTSDDTVDIAKSDPARCLAAWVHQVRSPFPSDPVLLAWYDTQTHYRISPALVNELLAGVAMDLTIHHYATFADLWLYCYRVASVVGLLSMGIIGAAPGAESYAIKLGVALQMTNILRDVGEDARRGRVYLPQEDLESFGLTAEDILAETYDERFCRLMQFEIARTHRLYDESWPGIALLSPDSRLAVGAAAQVYRGILSRIVANTYNVFHYRAHLTFYDKLRILPSIWWEVQGLGKRKRKKPTS